MGKVMTCARSTRAETLRAQRKPRSAKRVEGSYRTPANPLASPTR